MSHTHHISHIDLDGYSCTYLVKKYYSCNGGSLTQSNVDYGPLTKHLEEVLSRWDPKDPLDVLLITDLNLKAPDVGVLLEHKDRFKKLILIDHHVTEKEQLRRIEKEIPCFIGVVQGTSATKLTAQYLGLTWDKAENDIRFVDLVNTYDLFLIKEEKIFEFGRIYSDWFMGLIQDVKDLISPDGMRALTHKLLSDLSNIQAPMIFDDAVEYKPFEFYENICYRFANIYDNEYVDAGLINEYVCTTLQVRWAELADPQHRERLLAAMAIGAYGVAGTYVVPTEAGNVLISPVKLPYGVLHQLMYDMSIIDQYVMLSKPSTGRISLRQHALRPRVDLSKIAGLWGGGGHVGAAGCLIDEDWSTFQEKIEQAFNDEAYSIRG